jgi:putative ABC transport system permease protein
MWMSRLLAFLRRLASPRRTEQDLHDDVQEYADLVADELRTAGVSPEEARRQSRIAVGGVEPVKESVRSARTGASLEQAWQDIRYAVRGLSRSPGFASTAILTVGLGIGVNTAVFTVVDSALFKPLPYDRPEELVRLGHRTRPGTPNESTRLAISWSELAAWRAERAIFQGVEASFGGRARQWRERNESIIVSEFTSGMPAMLGVAPIRGRVFTETEAAEAAPVVIIAESLWTRAFGRRSDIVGATMTIDSRVLTIIGVMPAAFRFGPAGYGTSMAWTGLSERAADPVGSAPVTTSPWLRLRTGLTLDRARELAAVVAARMQAASPSKVPWTPHLMPIGDARSGLQAKPQMLMLLATAGLVLLVACVSVANLLLTRGDSRRQELAMRTALGASRGRLMRLLLTEGVVLASLGGVVAVAMATWTSNIVTALMPSEMQRRMFQVSTPDLDWRVLTFALVATMMVAALSAVWPAVSGSRVGLRASIGGGGQIAGPAPDRRRSRGALQAVQVAMAFLLAVIAGLFATSLATMLTRDLGFESDRVGGIRFALPEDRYPTREAQRIAVEEALTRVRVLPGVMAAAIGPSPASTMFGRMVLPGAVESSADLAVRTVGRDYFETAGIRLIAGRDFSPGDVPGSPRVAIIDQAGARRLFGSEAAALGRRFSDTPLRREVTIVGVVASVPASDFVTRPERIGVYLAESQDTPHTYFIVRTGGDLSATLKEVRLGLESFAPGVRITSAGPATDAYDESEVFAAPRFYVVLVSAFAILALVTSSVSLYGLLAHAVGRRRREIGVRIALGSTPGQIRSLVLTEALAPVLIGLAAGGIAAWWATRLVGSLLYEIGPRDPRVFTATAVVLVMAALVAALAPVSRATGVDPIEALRVQ